MGSNLFIKYEVAPVADLGDNMQGCDTLAEAEQVVDWGDGVGVVWGVYGVLEEGMVEHIADRQTEQEALRLVASITGHAPPAATGLRTWIPR